MPASNAVQARTPGSQSQTPTPASNPKKDYFGYVLLLLVLLNLAAIAGIAHYMQRLSERVVTLHDRLEQVSLQASAQKKEGIGHELQPTELGRLYPLEGFLVNINGENGPRFLQTQIELELENDGVIEELVKRKASVRDRVIVLLSSRNYRALREPAGLDNLRKDIRRSLNGLLKTGEIREVYFTQFHFN